jgi:hypothetical protein
MVKMKYDGGSFRDPSGYVFYHQGNVYRQINQVYEDDYNLLMSSGLYQMLVDKKILIPHEEISRKEFPESYKFDEHYKIIKPEKIPFVSYPYEWCFSQLKDAALTTLKIQRIALEHGMTLKDASSYNIQFKNGKPVFIDTLSFEKYNEGEPWVGYRQFCQHFLAPLSLMALKDVRFNQLLKIYIDGIPLDLASSILAFKTHFNFSLQTHIHFHAKTQQRYSDKSEGVRKHRVNKIGLLGIIDNLESFIRKLKLKDLKTEWANYYEDNNNYSSIAMEAKKSDVAKFLDKVKPLSVWDLGANNGVFSRIAEKKGISTIAFDIDPIAVEMNYLSCSKEENTKILPLLLDLTNPSPGIGWENIERLSFIERGPTDAALALALIHHLAISNNVPFAKLADFFAKITKWLIIEFVPKEDSQVQKLLATRKDVFPLYSQHNFEIAFSEKFEIHDSIKIDDSLRTLYLMKKK